MDIPIIIFLVTILIYVPLAGSLLYVWWKYGKGEKRVALVRGVFLLGSVALFWGMLFI